MRCFHPTLATLIALLAPSLAGSALAKPQKLRIVDWPIRFDAERRALTRQYIRRHYGLKVRSVAIKPRAIVIHWTGTPSLRGTWRAFNRVRIRGGRRHLRRAGRLNLSAHFLVARDGTVYRLLPETTMARHCIGLNYDSIGVENVGGGRRWPLTARQLRANARLVRNLAGRFPVRYLLGHMEWRRFERAPFFRELDPSYRSSKRDPGPRFMRRLRALVKDLGLRDRYTPARAPRRRSRRGRRRGGR